MLNRAVTLLKDAGWMVTASSVGLHGAWRVSGFLHHSDAARWPRDSVRCTIYTPDAYDHGSWNASFRSGGRRRIVVRGRDDIGIMLHRIADIGPRALEDAD